MTEFLTLFLALLAGMALGIAWIYWVDKSAGPKW